MTGHPPGQDRVTQAEEPLFVEHRPMTPGNHWMLVSLAFAPLVVAVFIAVDEGRWPDAGELGRIVVVGTLMLMLLYWVMCGRYGGERKHLRVDRQGLWVGGRLLPAHEIGACEVIAEPRARRLLFRQRYGDVLVNRPGSSYSLSHDGPPVLVRQERPGLRRKGWLVATAHPDELVAALRSVQAAHGDVA